MAQDVAEVLTLDEIKAILGEHLPDLTRRYHLKSLGVFGSYVRGEQRTGSDVDLLVEFVQSPDIFGFMTLEEELSSILGHKVDLVTKPSLHGQIGARILQEVVTL
ncbi:nucleotidyltransferase [bacterium]|nr:nucleotidyltransferase [bacterium]